MSDATENQSVQVSIAVMTEQINTIASGIIRIERIMSEQSQSLGEIPVIKRDVQELDEKVERAFKAIKALNDVQVTQAGVIAAQKTAAKIIGTLATGAAAVAMSVAGWSWTQLDTLKQNDTNIAIRVNSLEVRNIEADKFASFQRK